MLEILERICKGKAKIEELDLLENLGNTIKKTSLCGLGKTAPNPALSTLEHFRQEYITHIKDGYCPAGVCTELTMFSIVPDRCKACGKCIKACSVGAITGEKKVPHTINQDKCVRCGICRKVCSFDAIVSTKPKGNQ